MPRFTFEFSDSESSRFSDRRDFATQKLARQEAIRELSFMMSSRLPDGEHRTFEVSVQDETGATVYVASLRFDGRYPA